MSVLERVCIIEVFFLKRIYENFVGTLETVRNGEVSVLERFLYPEVKKNAILFKLFLYKVFVH